MVTVFETPRTLRASASSTLLSLPPITGGRSMDAYTMPGIRASMPKMAWPVRMSSRSTMGTFLPM